MDSDGESINPLTQVSGKRFEGSLVDFHSSFVEGLVSRNRDPVSTMVSTHKVHLTLFLERTYLK